jgi:serine protease
MRAYGPVLLIALLAQSTFVLASESENTNTSDASAYVSVDRLIVGWKKTAKTSASARAQKLASITALKPDARDPLNEHTDVVQLRTALSGIALKRTIDALRADPGIAYVSPDLRRHPHALTSDPLLTAQWYLLDQQPAATRTHLAWDITEGTASTVVAVLDTGVRFDHPDLGRVSSGGKLLAGYDFVANISFSNDGDGRDDDATDPGDWVDDTDLAQPAFEKCEFSNSSWHGTRVAGIVGAATNNTVGIAGAGFRSLILPVRVMGKCGGFDSDIIAGMRWAAGLPVTGAPANPTPAHVINLSLGGANECTSAYRAAIEDVLARGTLIVISAGNESGPVSSPGNCDGVLGVTGIRHVGTKTGLSNMGPEVGLSAPSGNCGTDPSQGCQFPIVVARNEGTKAPTISSYTGLREQSVGTSFSAPQVAAAAALMHSVNSKLSPGQLISLLQKSSTPFPVISSIPQCVAPAPGTESGAECNCTTQTCGAGMLNTAGAVSAAQRPFAIIHATGTASIGATLSLDASESFASDGRSVSAIQWSITNVVGASPVIAVPTEAMTTLQVPGATSFTLNLAITDDHGEQDTSTMSFATPSAPAPTPTTPSPSTPAAPSVNNTGGGGGGGEIGWKLMLLLIFLQAGISETRRMDRR